MRNFFHLFARQLSHNAAPTCSVAGKRKRHPVVSGTPMTRISSPDCVSDPAAFRLILNRELDAGRSCALMLFEIEGLTCVAEECGHATYRLLLEEIGDRLRASEPPDGAIARLTGQTFAMLISGRHPESSADAVALRFIRALDKPLGFSGGALRAATCIGVAHAPHDGRDATKLMASASLALSAARAALVGERALYGSAWRVCYRDASADMAVRATDNAAKTPVTV
jgi:predicted signal transduction protein with EAL and GGDEF domain